MFFLLNACKFLQKNITQIFPSAIFVLNQIGFSGKGGVGGQFDNKVICRFDGVSKEGIDLSHPAKFSLEMVVGLLVGMPGAVSYKDGLVLFFDKFQKMLDFILLAKSCKR